MPAIMASILPDRNASLVVEQVTLDAPKASEVLVKIAACGVCHSDPGVVSQAYDSVRRGGKVVVIGVANMMAQISVPHLTLVLQEKAVLGSCYGSARPQSDMPRLLKLDEMVTRIYKLSEVNQAFDDLRNGVNLRGVLVFS